MTRYAKPSLNEAELIDLWVSRGLQVPDRARAAHYIRNIGYYRLKAYSKVVTTNHVTHTLREGTTFEEVLSYYVFDRKLRLHTLDAIERLEVAIKARFCSTISVHCKDSHWYTNRRNFKDAAYHQKFLDTCMKAVEDSRDDFIKSYKTKYTSPGLPPSWMMFEILTFGDISKTYQNLDTTYQSLIASDLKINRSVLETWLHSIHVVRNICAHHSFLWNRYLLITPKQSQKNQGHIEAFKKVRINTYAATALICVILLQETIPSSQWRDNLLKLFKEFESIDYKRLGFEDDPETIFNLACPRTRLVISNPTNNMAVEA